MAQVIEREGFGSWLAPGLPRNGFGSNLNHDMSRAFVSSCNRQLSVTVGIRLFYSGFCSAEKIDSTGWDLERKRAYFDWAKQVVDALRGAHPQLEALFDETYKSRP